MVAPRRPVPSDAEFRGAIPLLILLELRTKGVRTVQQVQEGISCKRTSALRWLRAMEVLRMVERIELPKRPHVGGSAPVGFALRKEWRNDA